MKQRKISIRKCIGCQQMKNKKELIRIVKTSEGNFSVDFTGKKNGRGAYICPLQECLLKAHKSKGFEKSFKSSVPIEVYEKLKHEFDNITVESSE